MRSSELTSRGLSSAEFGLRRRPERLKRVHQIPSPDIRASATATIHNARTVIALPPPGRPSQPELGRSTLQRDHEFHQLDSAPPRRPLIHSDEMSEANKIRCHKNEMSQIFRQFVTEL